ncbi:hypothetical protein [Brevibacillus fluminis]|nr:hypothetical protein [Brevibacillus fluminis]
MDYMTMRQTAEKWGVSVRRIQRLYKQAAEMSGEDSKISTY